MIFLPVFTVVLLLVIAIAIAGRKNERSFNEKMNAFQERELAANAVRKQPLDSLAYISIPEEFLSFPGDEGEHDCGEAKRILQSLAGEKIVNLSSYTNTDLKELYGPANLPDLSRFDANYTSLVRSLQMYASYLAEHAHAAEAIKLLEFSLSTGCDMSASYKLLGQLYIESGRAGDVEALKDKAKALNSFSTPAILRTLDALSASRDALS